MILKKLLKNYQMQLIHFKLHMNAINSVMQIISLLIKL